MILETLEKRLAPAGIVSVILSGGTLKVTGDGDANSVTITETAENSYQITGTDGTVIRFNGQDGASATIDNVIKGVSLDMAGGDDNLLLTGISVAGSLSAQMGDGNNTITLTDVSTTGDLTLGAQKGNDSVTATDSTINVSGLTSINLSDGSNVVDLSLFASSFGKGLNYAGGTGTDHVTIDAPEVSFGGNVDFKVGIGGGAVGLNISTLTVKGSVSFTALDHATNISVFQISGENQSITGGLNVKHGAGDNSTQISSTGSLFVGGSVAITNGNSGTDQDSTTSLQTGADLTVAGSISVTNGTGAKTTLINAGGELFIGGKATIANGNHLSAVTDAKTEVSATGTVFIGDSLTVTNKTGNYDTLLSGQSVLVNNAISFSTVATDGNGSSNEISALTSLQAGSISIVNGAGVYSNTISVATVTPFPIPGMGFPDILTPDDVVITKGIVIKNGNTVGADSTSNSLMGLFKVGDGITIANGNGSFANTLGSMSGIVSLSLGKDLSITNGNGATLSNLISASSVSLGGSLVMKNGDHTVSAGNTLAAQELSVRGTVSLTEGNNNGAAPTTNLISASTGSLGSVSIKNGTGNFTNTLTGTTLNVTGGVSMTNGNGDAANAISASTLMLGSVAFKSGNGNGSNSINGSGMLDIGGAVSISNGTNTALALSTNITGGSVDIGGAVTVVTAGGNTAFSLQNSLVIGGPGIPGVPGAPGVVTSQIHVGSIAITNGAGEDHVSIGANAKSIHVKGGINVKNGAGDSDTGIGNGSALFVNGGVSVTALAGADALVVTGDGRIGGGVSASFGEGPEASMQVAGAIGGHLQVVGPVTLAAAAATERTITLERATFSGLSFTGGSVGDTASLSGVRILGGTKLDLGGGDDTVRIDDSTFNGAVTILTGAGEDEVNIETNEGSTGSSRFFGAVSVDLGADDDLFSIVPVDSAALLAHFFSTVTVNGGAGTGDEFEAGDAAKFVYPPTLTGFEVSSSN